VRDRDKTASFSYHLQGGISLWSSMPRQDPAEAGRRIKPFADIVDHSALPGAGLEKQETIVEELDMVQ
jgi:hypothetical protein